MPRASSSGCTEHKLPTLHPYRLDSDDAGCSGNAWQAPSGADYMHFLNLLFGKCVLNITMALLVYRCAGPTRPAYCPETETQTKEAVSNTLICLVRR